jgi:hypothetical protein
LERKFCLLTSRGLGLSPLADGGGRMVCILFRKDWWSVSFLRRIEFYPSNWSWTRKLFACLIFYKFLLNKIKMVVLAEPVPSFFIFYKSFFGISGF